MNGHLQLVSHNPVSINLEQLARMGPTELHRLYRQIFNSIVPAGNPELARRKIAWHAQASREGGLPQSARGYALAIASELGTRVRVAANLERRGEGLPLQHAITTGIVTSHDSRVPMPGSVIVRAHRGRNIVVHVLDAGFEYNGMRFDSLSALAKEITGTKWNGLAFFGLAKGKRRGR